MSKDSETVRNGKGETIIQTIERSLTWVLPATGTLIVMGLAFPFLNGEINRAWDELFHQTTQELVADAFANGRNPFGVLPTMFGIPGLRIYQCLQPLLAGFVQWITGLSPSVVHVWMVTSFFAATPWTYRYLLLKLGFSPIVAGAAGLLYIGSIAGFGNSFEAYFELGIVTQALGSLLLPLTLSKVVSVCKEGKGIIGAGMFFSLTVMAHAMYAVYALFIAIFIVIFYANKFKTIFKLSISALLALALAAGWLIPFLQVQRDHKPITDIVARPGRIVWSAAHSGASLGRAIFTGRTLDGGRKDNSADEKLDNKLNMTGTREVRFPYYTLLAALGLILAIVRHRRRESLFMVSGLAFGLLLILGFDDFQFMYKFPVLNKIQPFRVGYFIEFFAIGLAAYGLCELIGLIGSLVEKITSKKIGRSVLVAITLIAVCLYTLDLVRIVSPLLNTWDKKHFARVDGVLKKLDSSKPSQRVLVKFNKPPSRQFRCALEHSLELFYGHSSVCNHWTSLSPSINLQICALLAKPGYAQYLTRMMGVRSFVLSTNQLSQFISGDFKHKSSYKLLGKSGRHMRIIEDNAASMIHIPAGSRVLVIGDSLQWYWLTHNWLSRFGRRAENEDVPWLLRGTSETLSDESVIKNVDGIIYVDASSKDQDANVLAAIAATGKKILSGFPIDGVKTHVMKPKDKPWYKLLNLGKTSAINLKIKRLDFGKNPEYAAFETDGQSDASVLFSMQAFKGWKAKIDGKYVSTMAGGPDIVSAIVPAGKHKLEFVYEESTLMNVSMGISFFAWFSLLVLSLIKGFFWTKKRLFCHLENC